MAFPEHTLESGMPHCSVPGVPLTLGRNGPANEESPEQDGSESKRMFVTI